MDKHENEKRNRIYDLIRQGYMLKEIVEMTGYSYSTVKRCREEIGEIGSLVYEKERGKKSTDMPDLEIEWTAVVNVIRYYTGCKEPIPLPAGKVHPNPLWQKVTEENIERFGTKMRPLPLPQTSSSADRR